MHEEILTKNQKKLLSYLNLFAKDFYLVGGTAIALYIGHRRSIDFDLFTNKSLKKNRIKNLLIKNKLHVKHILYEDYEQLHVMIDDVKLTFFYYPYIIQTPSHFKKIIKLPSLLDLASMKAYALGGRAKWKDYVDLYFLLKNHFSLNDISDRAKILFGNLFNGKLFREQLSYFKDIDYSESVEYIVSEISPLKIKKFLKEISISKF